jgi:hypothetical protein
MMKFVCVVACLLLVCGDAALAEAITFGPLDIGLAPKGWTATKTGRGTPKWTVERDDKEPDAPLILQQSGTASYPLALKDGLSMADGTVEVQFKAIAGKEDRAAGLVWRAKDAANYYVVRANALEDNVVLYKTVNGVRSSLNSVGSKQGYGVNVLVSAGTWHSLKVSFAGSRFKVSYNGKDLFEVDDSSFSGQGKVGLWTKADSVARFRNFNVSAAK